MNVNAEDFNNDQPRHPEEQDPSSPNVVYPESNIDTINEARLPNLSFAGVSGVQMLLIQLMGSCMFALPLILIVHLSFLLQ